MKLEPTIEIKKRIYVPLHVVTPETHGLFYVPVENVALTGVKTDSTGKLYPKLLLVETSSMRKGNSVPVPHVYVTKEQLELNKRVLPTSRVTKSMSKVEYDGTFQHILHRYGVSAVDTEFPVPCLDSEFWRRKFLRWITRDIDRAHARVLAAMSDLAASQKIQRELLETFGMYKESRK